VHRVILVRSAVIALVELAIELDFAATAHDRYDHISVSRFDW